jgi:hypothetical protein
LPNENLTKEGYKQVIVIITPQAGSRITRIHLNVNLQNGSTNNSFSDIKISADTMDSLYGNIRGQFLLKNFEFTGSSLTKLGLAFYDCRQLERVKIADVSKITNAYYSFGATYSLKEVICGEFTALTNASRMFQSSNIKEVDISLPAVTDLSYFAYSSRSIKKITFRKLNENGFKMLHAFNATNSLKEVQYDGVMKLTDDNSYAFLNAHNIRKIPALNLNASTGNTRILENNKNLTSVNLTSIKESISIKYTRLSRGTLVNIFNNLVDMSEERTIDVRGCFGAKELTDADVAIATNKNWVVIK